MAHAELGRGEHQPRVLEARRVAAEELQVRGHAPARLDLHGGEVGDLQAAVAGQARAHEEPDVVAPAGVRRLEVAELLVAALEQRAVVLGVGALPRDPLGEVDARPRPRRVDAVLDVGALALDVGLVGRAGGGAHVEVAGGVDDDLGQDRAPALLALEDRAAQLVAVDDRVDDPGVQDQARADLLEQLDRLVLQPLGVDHRRPGDDVAEGAQALAPVRDLLGLPRAPLLLGRARDRVGRQALEDLRGEAGDDLAPLPVAHPVDPDHEAAGGETAEVVVALDERDLGAEPARRHGGRAAGGAAADDEHVGLLVDRGLARGLVDRALRAAASSGSAGRSVPSMNQLSRPVWYWSTPAWACRRSRSWPWCAMVTRLDVRQPNVSRAPQQASEQARPRRLNLVAEREPPGAARLHDAGRVDMAPAGGVAFGQDERVLGERGEEAPAQRARVRRRLGVGRAAHRRTSAPRRTAPRALRASARPSRSAAHRCAGGPGRRRAA